MCRKWRGSGFSVAIRTEAGGVEGPQGEAAVVVAGQGEHHHAVVAGHRWRHRLVVDSGLDGARDDAGHHHLGDLEDQHPGHEAADGEGKQCPSGQRPQQQAEESPEEAGEQVTQDAGVDVGVDVEPEPDDTVFDRRGEM